MLRSAVARIALAVAVPLLAAQLSACSGNSSNSPDAPLRTFQTGFESIDDFAGFYISPQNHLNSASHEQSSERVRSGQYAHKGWLYAANPPSTALTNNNHRGYPTVQLYKIAGGGFRTPALVEFWVWLDVQLAAGEWFSFATLDHTTADRWDPAMVNLSDKGFVHLMHVPRNSEAQYKFQTTAVKFPMRQWVKLAICIDFTPGGDTRVWQNDELVSAANTGRGDGQLTQLHFGLYAPPSLSSGVVYNDDLVIKEGTCDK